MLLYTALLIPQLTAPEENIEVCRAVNVAGPANIAKSV